MNRDFQISEDQMDQINIFSGKIMGMASFLTNIQPDDISINVDDIFSDFGVILHSAGKKIQEIIGEVQKAAMISVGKKAE